MKNNNEGPQNSKKTLFLAITAIAVLVIICLIFIIASVLSTESAKTETFDKKLTELEKLYDQAKWDQVDKLGNELLKMEIDQTTKVSVYWELSIAQSSQKKFEKGIEYANEIVKIDIPSGHFLLGLIYRDMQNYEQAKKEFQMAGATGPRYKKDADNYIMELDQLLAK